MHNYFHVAIPNFDIVNIGISLFDICELFMRNVIIVSDEEVYAYRATLKDTDIIGK